jgi:hypothetical protein
MHSEFHKSVDTPFKHSGMTTRVSIVPSKPLFGSINLNYQMVPTAYPQLLNSGFLHLTSLSLSLSLELSMVTPPVSQSVRTHRKNPGTLVVLIYTVMTPTTPPETTLLPTNNIYEEVSRIVGIA